MNRQLPEYGGTTVYEGRWGQGALPLQGGYGIQDPNSRGLKDLPGVNVLNDLRTLPDGVGVRYRMRW